MRLTTAFVAVQTRMRVVALRPASLGGFNEVSDG